MKIRTKIILFFFIAVLVSVIVGFFVVQFFTQRTLVSLIGNYNTLIARDHIESIDRIIYRRIEEWSSYVTNNESIHDILKVSNAEFANLENWEDYIRDQDKSWKSAPHEENTVFMESLINNSISVELKSQTSFYEDRYGYDIFPEIFITNKYGAVVALTDRISDYYQADEEWWQKTKEEKSWVSDIIYDESTGVYALELCIRIDDQNNNFLGIVKVIYSINDISNIVDEIIKERNSNSGHLEIDIPRESVNAYLLTSDGKLIYSIDNGFGNLVDRSDILKRFSRQMNNLSYIIASENGVEKMFSHFHSEGYKDFKSLGWSLVITKDTKEALSPLIEITNAIVVGAFLSILIAILLGLAVSNSLSKPIIKLHQGTEIIGKGDLNYKVGTNSKDEIGQLSRSFDKMTGLLKKSITEVEKKIANRTLDLEKLNKAMTGRELKMIELKKKIEELSKKEKNK